MSQQIQITGGAKVRNLEGVLTGTSGVVDALGINVPDGIPQLDGSGKILVSQLPNSVMEYKGTWNAATNTPTLANGTGNAGDVYLCNVAGTVNFGAGPITFAVGDQVLYSGTTWERASGATGTVTSVAVTESGDALTITGSPITTSGTINIGFAGTGAQYVKGDGTLATFPTTIDQAKRLITEVYNSTGSTLTKGTVVYINGGQGNLPTITKAIATGDSTSAQTYGVVQSDITDMNNGFVVVLGSLTDIDTQAYSVGTQLYLSGSTAGAWTSTKPSAPIHLVYVGIVVRSHPTQGVVEIRIQNGYELEELHDVAITSVANNDGIFYNSSNDLWENKTIDEVLGYTPANDSLVVHLAGTETITGAKTFSQPVTISTASYLTSRLKLTNTATGGNIWSVSSGNANNSTNNSLFTIINETLSKNVFVLSPTGKLVIGADMGTTNPADALAVYDTNTIIKAVDLTGNNSSATLQATNTASYLIAGYSTTAIPLIFKTGNTDRLTIAANGAATFSGSLTANSIIKSGGASTEFLKADGSIDSNTYLTTSSASSTYLPLSGGTLTGILSLAFNPASTTGGMINIRDNAATGSNTSFGGVFFNSSPGTDYSIGKLSENANGFLQIRNANSGAELLRIASTGAATFSSSVTAGGNILVPAGSGLAWSGDTSRIMTPEDNVSGALIQTPGIIRFNAGGSERMRITSGGNVGIGTSSPSYQLQLSTDSAAKPTSALWTIASDERIKENINPYNKGLKELLLINPITYDYNGLGGFKKGKGGVGIIAQEIINILPDSVSSIKAKLNEEDEEEIDILNFNGHELTYILINSIKEQQAQIEELKAKIK